MGERKNENRNRNISTLSKKIRNKSQSITNNATADEYPNVQAVKN